MHSKKNKIECQVLFNAIDQKNDGIIDVKEFVSFFIYYFELEENRNQFKRTFKSIFKLCNKNNMIDRKQFKRVYDAFSKKNSYDKYVNKNNEDYNEKKIYQIGTFLFNVINQNHSGKINDKEMIKFCETLKVTKEKLIKQFIDELDDNKDGKIDLNEFLNWFQGCFNDVNNIYHC